MKKITQALFFVILPSLALLLCCFLRTQIHTHTRVASLGEYYINSYFDSYGDKFYELTTTRRMLGHRCDYSDEKVVMRRVYAFIIRDEKLYVRANTGDAVIEANGFCRLFPAETAPKIVGDDIFILPSAKSFFPQDYQIISLMTHHYNAYSAHDRDVVALFGSGRFRIENVTDTDGLPALALIDALQLEGRTGRAIRLLSHVTKYEVFGDALVVFAKEGIGIFHDVGTKYSLLYFDSGVYKNVYCAADIKLLRNEQEFTVADRALINTVTHKSAAS